MILAKSPVASPIATTAAPAVEAFAPIAPIVTAPISVALPEIVKLPIGSEPPIVVPVLTLPPVVVITRFSGVALAVVASIVELNATSPPPAVSYTHLTLPTNDLV